MGEQTEQERQQELNQKFQMFEQQIRLVQEQTQAVEQTLVNLQNIGGGLNEIVGKEGSEILAQVGNGIYAKAKLVSDELLVDVGDQNFIKKSVPETKKILEEQIDKLNGIKGDLNREMERINQELTNVYMEYQGKK